MNLLKIFEPFREKSSLLRNKSKKEEFKEEFLVLDFGKSAVKGLIFERNREGNIIKKFVLQEIERFGVFDGKDFELEIVKKATVKTIESLGVKNKVYGFGAKIGLPPDVLKPFIITVFFNRENGDEIISKQEQDQIYRKVFSDAQSKLFEEVKEKYAHEPGDIQIVKQKILEKNIVGYEVSSLLGFRGGTLIFKILIIFAIRDGFKFFQRLIDSLKLKNYQIFHEVEGLINFQRLGSNIPQIFLDIGSRTTQIFYFEKGLRFVNEFQVGGWDFSKALCNDFGVKEEEAENLKQRFLKDQLSQGTRERFEKILSSVFDYWQSLLQRNLREKTGGFHPLPRRISIFGGGSLLPGIKKMIQEGNLKDFASPYGLEVNFLDIKDLLIITSFPPGGGEVMTGFPSMNKAESSISVRVIPVVLLSIC